MDKELVKYLQNKIDYLYKSLERQHDNGYKNWARGNLKAYEDILFQLIKQNNISTKNKELDRTFLQNRNRETSGLFENGYIR